MRECTEVCYVYYVDDLIKSLAHCMDCRKCHFKDETIVQGDAVYVRCNDQVNEGDDSWKLGNLSHQLFRFKNFY